MLKDRRVGYAALGCLLAAWIGFVVLSNRPNHNNHVSAAQQQHNQSNDDQLEPVARYTLWLADATIAFVVVTVVISSVQFYFLRRADTTARISANAAKIAADQVEKNTRRELRAYIAVDPGGTEILSSMSPSIARIRIRNVGRVPARNVSWIFYGVVDPDDMRETFPIVEANIVKTDVVLAPMQESPRWGKVAISYANDQEIEAGASFYIWGVVRYFDGISDEERFTRFCHRTDKHGRYYDGRGWRYAEERFRIHQYGNNAS